MFGLTLVLLRLVATAPQEVLAPLLKNVQSRGKLLPVPLGSSFPLIKRKKLNLPPYPGEG